jgi:hypothetical protein
MTTPLSQLRRIELLERQQAAAAQQLRAQFGRQDVGAGKRWHYLARTVAIGEETYPGDGANTFGLVFLDREYTPTAGAQGVTDADRASAHQAIGRTINGQWILEGELVEAIPSPPPPGTTDKGRWSIVPLRPYYWGKLSTTLNPGSSATVRVWKIDSGGTWVDTGFDQTVWDRAGSTIDTNTWICFAWEPNPAGGGRWVVITTPSEAGEEYRTAIGVIGASNLAATNLATNPGNITPTAATNSEGTVPLSSSVNNAIFWPDLNGSSQIVFSRNLLADKTFYNATPFAMVSGDRVWVQEFPVQDGAGDARDVDTGLGKRWIVRGFQRTKPYALLTSSGWNGTDFKLDWTITSQKGGLVSLVNSNKHVQFDIPVYQYPFKVTVSGFLHWSLSGNPLSIHFQSVLNGFRTDQWMVHLQPVNSPTTVTTGTPSVTTTSGPSSDMTGAASAGTAHTHSLSGHTHEHSHTHTWAKSDLQVGPKNYDLFSGYAHPWHFDMVGYKPDITQNDVTWLSITPLGGCSVSGLLSGGGSNVQMLIEPMFDG